MICDVSSRTVPIFANARWPVSWLRTRISSKLGRSCAAAISGGSGDAESAISDRQLADKLIEMGRLNSYQADQLLNGRTKFDLGPYRILDSIAQGGMGEVFKAEHSMMGRIVAVKVLPRSKSTPEAIKSFTREIRAQAQLDHENLVRAFDAGHDGNVYFLVTEYVPGTDLRRYVRNRGPLSMREAATIISQAAAGLQHAHEPGLIHRDVKPGNILVTPDGQTQTFRPRPGRLVERRRRQPAPGQGRRHGRLSAAGTNHVARHDHAGRRHLFAGLHAVLRGDRQSSLTWRNDPRKGPSPLHRHASASASISIRR